MRAVNHIYTLSLAAICCFAGACKKYLDVPPVNQRTPVTVEDYTEMLNGEGWNRNISQQGSGVALFFLDMMTADVDENVDNTLSILDERGAYSAFYTWQNRYDARYDERRTPSSLLNDNWLGLYRIIATCNVILDAEQRMQGDEASRKYLIGEACFSRALAYYFLVNIWGRPYDPANPADPMGVPLKTDGVVENVFLARSTVADCYYQILNDLLKAEQYILASGKQSNVYHYSPAAIYLLLSRTHLYMRNWEQAVSYAGKCLEQQSTLFDINHQTFSENDFFSYFFSPENPEIIYTYHNYGSHYSLNVFGSDYSISFKVADSLMQLYTAGEQRKGGFYCLKQGSSTSYTPKVYNAWNAKGTLYNFSFRTAEAYLNRAEANAHLGKTDEALADINLLNRNRTQDTTPVDITDKEQLLHRILEERRKELAFQLHNWFDLRRTGMPSITHYFTPLIDDQLGDIEKFVLQKNDPGYTLEIPIAALQANPVLQPLGLPGRKPE